MWETPHKDGGEGEGMIQVGVQRILVIYPFIARFGKFGITS